MVLPPPVSPLFPYTTLFRSLERARQLVRLDAEALGGVAHDRLTLLARRGAEPRRGDGCTGSADHNCGDGSGDDLPLHLGADRKSTRLNSSHTVISYAVFCLK